jgi:hypothetical protein
VSLLACRYLRVGTCVLLLVCRVDTCLSCRYLIIYVCHLLDHLLVCCRVATCLGVEGIMCRRWCMALATDFCVWHICFYIYLCAFHAVELAKLQTKKKFWATIRRGQCRRRRGCNMPVLQAMPRGWPSAYELYAEGYAVGV